MAKHSISEAAKLAGVSRSHFYKKFIRPNLITVERDKDDKPVIDTAEIMRVCGELKFEHSEDIQKIQNDTGEIWRENTRLEAENKALREQLLSSADREKWLQGKIDQLADQLAATTKLLEYKPTPEQKKAGLFARLFGR